MMRRLFMSLVVVAAYMGVALSACGEVTSLSVWQHIPVLESGRVMPLDSYARQTLLRCSGKSTFERKPASLWLARVLFTPDATRDDAIFLVNNPEVVEALGLSAEGRDRYSFNQLEPAMAELTRLARAAFQLENDARSPVENELISLYHNVNQHARLMQAMDFTASAPEFQIADEGLRRDLGLAPDGPVTIYDLCVRQQKMASLAAAHRESANPQDQYGQELFRATMAVRMWTRQRGGSPPMLLPHGRADKDWMGPWDAILTHRGGADFVTELVALRDMAVAFRDGRQVDFDLAGRRYLNSVHGKLNDPNLTKKLRGEVRFNTSDAFYRSELLYGFAFLLALLSVPFRTRLLYRLAFGLTILALIPHTYGIIARMVIMGRPPVTNLYSTFVFVSWASVLIGLAVEYFQRNRLGLITASSIGLALLLTSGRFATDNDTMGVMVAVLDSNFWLATHVVTISIGYAGCVAAGLLGHIYLLQALRKVPGDPALKESYNAMYGALAFGLIFSFLGTMLGGVWADQSWGRFWGWDPKENGALVIVLWSAILFHAKLDKWIGPRGFAAGCVLGVIWVLLAWLGVNLLSVGLHSYGFTSGIARGLAIACGFEILFVLATVPFARKSAG